MSIDLFAGAIKFNRAISYTGKSSIGDNIFLYTQGSDMKNFYNNNFDGDRYSEKIDDKFIASKFNSNI